MKDIAYYPGCSLEGTGRPYDESLKMCLSLLGENLVEIPDWNCCGASSAHVLSERLSFFLPARNLALAESISSVVLCPCAECYSRMYITNESMRQDKNLYSEINKGIYPLRYGCSLDVMNVVDFLLKVVGLPKMRERVKRRFEGKVFLSYYGCLLTRTPGFEPFDSSENPTSMERIVEVTGAKSPDWPYKMKCCGGSLALVKESVGLQFVKDIISCACKIGADAIVTACPLCQVNLDLFQEKLERSGERLSKKLPILYISELLSHSFGLDLPRRLISSHFVGVDRAFGG